MPMPWRMAAGRMASPASAKKVRPLGCTMIWNGPAAAVAAVMLSISSGLFDVVSEGIVPSNQTPLGALPARFRRPRFLIVGCGDVGLRAARMLPARSRVLALTSSPARIPELRAAGVVPLQGD